MKIAVDASACCAGVAPAVVGNETASAKFSAEAGLRGFKMVGDTGLEPVTLSLSS
jgi:hypothetical protein